MVTFYLNETEFFNEIKEILAEENTQEETRRKWGNREVIRINHSVANNRLYDLGEFRARQMVERISEEHPEYKIGIVWVVRNGNKEQSLVIVSLVEGLRQRVFANTIRAVFEDEVCIIE